MQSLWSIRGAGRVVLRNCHAPLATPATLALALILSAVLGVVTWLLHASVSRGAVFDPVPLLTHKEHTRSLGSASGDFCAHTWWIFQATKEFGGVASVGGAGLVVNSLVAGTLHTPCTHTTVVLPLYDFLMRDSHVKPLSRASASQLQPSPADLANGASGAARVQYADAFTVYRLDRSHAIYASMGNHSSRLLVLLVGPPQLQELQDVYAVPGPGSLYESSASVPSQTRDFVFAAQAAEVACAAVACGPDTRSASHVAAVRDLAAALRDPVIWMSARGEAGTPPARDVRAVWQLHGAPTSQVATAITHRIAAVLRPAIVYTLHDAAYEFMYMLPEGGMTYMEAMRMLRVARGTPGVTSSNAPVIAATVAALRYSDAVTTVSTPLRSALLDIAINSVESVLTDLLCDALQGRRVHGINNALSHELDPSSNPLPVQEHGTFVIGQVLQSKHAAKQALVDAGVLPASVSAHGAFVMLFIGRFEGVKGFQFTPAAAEELCTLGAHLVVMGGFPAGMDASMAEDTESSAFNARPEWQKQVLLTYAWLRTSHGRASACPVTIIDTPQLQLKFGTLIRAAADFALVPSLSEAFGLVAEEALLYGAMPVTSNVGGLMAIVRNHPGFAHMGQGGAAGDVAADSFWNGVQFRMDDTHAEEHMRAAIRHAQAVMTSLTPALREVYVSAVAFARVKWTEPGGPGDEYLNAFADAYRRREDTTARVQLQEVHALKSCRHATIDETDWSPNLVLWPAGVRPSGSAKFRVGAMPTLIKLASRNASDAVMDVLAASEGATVAGTTPLRVRDVIIITADTEHRQGGCVAEVKSYRELWLLHDAAMQEMRVHALAFAQERFAQLEAAAARSGVLRASADTLGTVAAPVRAAMLEHFVHAMMTRITGPDMLIVVSVWSAPLTPLQTLPGATESEFAYRMIVDVDYVDGTEKRGVQATFPRFPVGMWTERRIVLPLKQPFRSVRVYMEVWGVTGTVAFDEPEVRLHIQRA